MENLPTTDLLPQGVNSTEEQSSIDSIVTSGLENQIGLATAEIALLRQQVSNLLQSASSQEQAVTAQVKQLTHLFNTSREDLQNEITSLRTEVRRFQTQIEGQMQSAGKGESARFLITEFEQLVEFWKITDARHAGYISLYLTACTIIVTGSAVVVAYLSSTSVMNERLVVAMAGILALGLFVLGFYLVRSLVTTRKLKNQYRQALNVIRGYFVDQDPNLQDYLMLPFASGAAILSSSTDKPMPGVGSLLLVWECLLTALVVGCVAWLIEPKLLWISILAASIIGAGLCYLLLYRQMVRWFRRAK